MGHVEVKTQQPVANGRFGYPVQQQRLGMVSAKAKKKRKMRRKLAKKKKKLKLTEPLKEAEREANMLKQLRLASAKFDSNCSQGKVVLQDEMGLSTDGKAAKFLRGGRSSRQSGDPTTSDTSDVGASQFRANQFRKTSANSDTPKFKQQPERHFGRRAPPPPLQKLDSVNRPIKTAVFSPRPLAPTSLPRPAISPAPPPNSRRLIALKPQLPLPVTGIWPTTIWMKVASTFKVPEPAAFLKAAFTPPIKAKKSAPNLLPLHYRHAVTVHKPSIVPPPQPAAEAQSAEPPRSSPDSQAAAKQPASSTKSDDTQCKAPTEKWRGWLSAYECNASYNQVIPYRLHESLLEAPRIRSASWSAGYQYDVEVRQDEKSTQADHPRSKKLARRASEPLLCTRYEEKLLTEAINLTLVRKLIQTAASAPTSTAASAADYFSMKSDAAMPLVIATGTLNSL